jgi:hypothetical protein
MIKQAKGNLNKLFEKIIYDRLCSYLRTNNILSQNQFGFKKGQSTETAMLQLVSYIMPAFEERKFALGVYLDFSKAFDTVDHSILLKKLEKYGIRGLALNLVRSYLNNRVQHVKFNTSLSGPQSILTGVPQGSCLGPLLYCLYTNDLSSFLQNMDNVMYADDTTLIECGNDVVDMVHDMNNVLLRLFEWCKFNKLALNISKTKSMLFTNRNEMVPLIKINDLAIENVNSFKYLGVFFDPKLKFQAHIDYLNSRLSTVVWSFL